MARVESADVCRVKAGEAPKILTREEVNDLFEFDISPQVQMGERMVEVMTRWNGRKFLEVAEDGSVNRRNFRLTCIDPDLRGATYTRMGDRIECLQYAMVTSFGQVTKLEMGKRMKELLDAVLTAATEQGVVVIGK